jgi:hypothetical protein
MEKRFTFIFIIALISLFTFAGWESTGHKKINYFSTVFFPSEMSAFKAWNYSLSSHASDADTRKNTDPTEKLKHYINLDYYSRFLSSDTISQNIADANQYWGILPWATITAVDSLTSEFKRKDWQKAILTTSDLGHYVGDGHNPLHITGNFDGKTSSQKGIHSRYEGDMIDKYSYQITFTADSVNSIENIPGFVFNYLYENYKYVDSIFLSDDYAHTISTDTKSTAYYDALWSKTKPFTLKLFSNAAKRLAALIYTAWTNAGKPQLNTSFTEKLGTVLNGFEVYQNYPNPFNPETKIKFSVPTASKVKLKLYDTTGKEILTLIDEEKQKGVYEYKFNASSLPSGIYFYNFSIGSYSVTKKMALLK